MFEIQKLKDTLAKVAKQAENYSGKGITEQDTKHALIGPVLEALGWSMTDLDVVRAEYRHTSRDNPVDYALFSKGHPVLFVEAKALNVSITEHRFVTQVLNYANVSGVGWALLTNGMSWALYRVFANVQADQKKLFSVDVADPMAAEWLQWVVPARLACNDLDNMWRHYFAERKIRDLLLKIIQERDSDLVAFLSQRSGLDQKDVTAGLHHLQVSFGEPEPGLPLMDFNRVPESSSVQQADQELPNSSANQEHSKTHPLKPTTFYIGEHKWTVRAWKELPIIACNHLAEINPQKYQGAFDAEDFVGRKRRLLNRSPEGMKRPEVIPGGYIEVNLSAKACQSLVKRLLVFCGEDPNTARCE